MELALPRLYAIIDAQQIAPQSPVDVASALLAAGVRLIQYRNKEGGARDLYQAAIGIGEIAKKFDAKLIVNDRADVALAAGSDGVHVGQQDIPPAAARRLLPAGSIVGISTHSIAQLQAASQEPVDYIAFGPIFPTTSKSNPDPTVGLDGLSAARKAARRPLVAIGGITIDNARSVIAAGADSVAVIGGLLSAPDIGAQARKWIAALDAR